MTEIRCTYNNLATTISNISEPGTYGLKIRDPSNIQIKASSAVGSLGYILSQNIVDDVFFDLTYTDLTKANLVSLDYAFKGCTNIIRVGALPDNLLTSGEGTFMNCTALVTADIDSFDNVLDASFLFKGCSSLKSVSVNRLTKVTEADEMFAGCSALTSVDICMMGLVVEASNMFKNCTSLETVILSKQFIIDLKSSTDMLSGCTNLKNIKQVDPAIIDRSTTINGNLEINGKLVVSDASENKGAIIHGEVITDNIHANTHLEVPTINTSNMYIGNNLITSVDNTICIDGNPIGSGDSGSGINTPEGSLPWDGQVELGKISSGNRIILITKVDNTHASTLSGQILFYGPSQILGTYHIDLNGNGERSFIGASSGEQANIIYCDYENEKYFGLKFPGTAEGTVYFIGWNNTGTLFAPPANNTYSDADILVLNSYGYSVTKELSTQGLSIKPNIDGPSMQGCIQLGELDGTNKIFLLIKKSTAYNATIGGQLFEYGNGINSMYHFSISTNGSKFLSGSSSYDERATLIQVTYEGDTYFGIKFPSGKPAKLLFQGFDTRSQMVKPPVSYGDDDLETFQDTISDGKDVAEAIDVPSATDINASFRTIDESLNVLVAREAVYENIKILNEVPTQLFAAQAVAGETGYLYASGAGKILAFNVAGPCRVNYSFSLPTDVTITNANVTITDTLVNYSTTDARVNQVASGFFDYSDTNPRTLYVAISKPMNIHSLSVTYRQDTVTNLGANIIANLPETGDNTYHIVKLNNELTKTALINLAKQLRESDKQVYLDLSECTVHHGGQYDSENAYEWVSTGQNDSNSLGELFTNCTGLRGLKLPQGVTRIKGDVFYSCISLKELVFNEGLIYIGANNQSSLAGLFAATPLTSLELPASIQTVGTYFLTNSNIKSVVFKSPNASIRANTQLLEYYCFAKTQAKLTLYMDDDLKNYINNNWWGSQSSCGTDLTDRIKPLA